MNEVKKKKVLKLLQKCPNKLSDFWLQTFFEYFICHVQQQMRKLPEVTFADRLGIVTEILQRFTYSVIYYTKPLKCKSFCL